MASAAKMVQQLNAARANAGHDVDLTVYLTYDIMETAAQRDQDIRAVYEACSLSALCQ